MLKLPSIQKIRISFFFPIIVFSTSCITSNDSLNISSPPCITENDELSIKKTLMGVYKRFNGSEPSLKMTEKSCTKRIYQYKDSLFIIYRNNKKIEGKLTQLNGMTLKKLRESATQCLKAGESLAESLHDNIIDRVISQNKIVEKEIRNDPDIGVVSWLNCPYDKGLRFNESVVTLIHELNHSNNTKDNCIFNPESNREYCFDVKELPELNIAYIKKLPTNIPPAIVALNSIQDLYLQATNNNFVNLLDEMVSYSIGSRVQAKFLNEYGKSSIFEGENTRDAQFLSLLMTLNAKFLIEFSQRSPKRFESFYSGKTRNEIDKLFTFSEKNYQLWKQALKKIGKKPKQPEEALFDLYKELKTVLP